MDHRDRPAALARLLSRIENREPGYETLLRELEPQTGRARRIGVTGPSGAGKSTLVQAMVRVWRAQGKTVAVVAVDPSSPRTGGALLGDRIRMQAVSLDPGVFIRSMATRGAAGGIAPATGDVCAVLDAAGYDRIVVETVGVGQTEIAVARATDVTVLVLVPESGDAIQALKAGLMEVADVFVVNKADRPGATHLASELKAALGLQERSEERAVFLTVATTGTGIPELVTHLESRLAGARR
jgi:LAO/AO transport system kinase